MTNTDGSPYQRPLPELTPENEFFWTAGRDGVLRVQRSIPCGALLFPPTPVCPYCHSTEIDVVEVSGRGTVVGYTVNAHQWLPDDESAVRHRDGRARGRRPCPADHERGRVRARCGAGRHEGGGGVQAAGRRVVPAVRAHRRSRARPAARRGRDQRRARRRWRRPTSSKTRWPSRGSGCRSSVAG